jgi:hypothetical protein
MSPELVLPSPEDRREDLGSFRSVSASCSSSFSFGSHADLCFPGWTMGGLQSSSPPPISPSNQAAAVQSAEPLPVLSEVQRRGVEVEVGEESFGIFVGPDGQVVESNQADDYQYRPTELEAESLYFFTARFKLVPRPKKAPSSVALSKANLRRNRLFLFQPGHPRFATHAVRARTLIAYPVLEGAAVPSSRNENPTKKLQYMRSLLLLFQPFRSAPDLRADGETWEEAYLRFQPSEECSRIIANLDSLHRMKEEADKEAEERQVVADDPRFRTRRLNHDPRLAQGETDHQIDAAVAAMDEAQTSPSGDPSVLEAVASLDRLGFFNPEVCRFVLFILSLFDQS